MDVSEKDFEAAIERALLAGGPDASPFTSGTTELAAPYGDFAPGGYRKRTNADYDPVRCLLPQDAHDFIQAAFAPYYENAILSDSTDPNLLYDLHTVLAGFELYTQDDIQRFAEVYWHPRATQARLHAALQVVVDRYGEKGPATKSEFRGRLGDYLRLYTCLSQVLPFADADLEKLDVFGRQLLRKLPVPHEELPIEFQQNISMDSYRVQETGKHRISLQRGVAELDPMGAKAAYIARPDELDVLSQIIRVLNERFGTNFTEEDRVCIQELEERLAVNAALEASVRANTPENARLAFNNVVNDLLQEMVDGHFKFYKQVNDDADFAKTFLDILFKRYLSLPREARVPSESGQAEPVSG